MTKRKLLSLAVSADNSDKDDGPDGDIGAPYQVFTKSRVSNEYSIYLSNPVIEPDVYDEVCHLLRSVSENDEVKLYLNTPGGALISGMAIIQAMRDCKATITTILNPQAFSMGALMFLAGDQKVAPPNSLLMFHNYSGGMSGKGNEQVAELSAINAWFEEAMHNICSPFLTKKELRDVLQGKDLWMGSAEINRRLQELKKATKK
jgi:ATP-dependent Clp endopeptidase proteolytic subunit ClpP